MPASALEAARGADVVLHADRVVRVPGDRPGEARVVVAAPRIVDGRNALDPATWRAAGWTYRALGRALTRRPLTRRP